MITRLDFIKNLDKRDGDFFSKNNMPQIDFLLKCAVDYGYVTNILDNKVNAENDARMKVAGELLKKGVEFIPVVGDLLGMLAEFGGIDFGALGSISDSLTASRRMREWVSWINANYTNMKNDLPPLSNMNKTFAQLSIDLYNTRPKCYSLTENCSKEHQRYIARTSLVKESQQALYDIYYNYCINDYTYTNWVKGQYIKNSGGVITQTEGKNKTLPLLLLSLLFLKG